MKQKLNRLLGNYTDRAITVTRASFYINAVIGVGELIVGVYLLSAWFVISAFYYLVLCVARGQILRKYASAKMMEIGADRYKMECTIFRQSGVFMALLGVSYFMICSRMYFYGEVSVQNGNTVYLVALVSFTKLGLAISGTISTRRLKTPLVLALKIISFADAMVSIVMTQCTLLTAQKSEMAVSSSAVFGMAVSLGFLSVGIGMLVRKGIDSIHSTDSEGKT